MQADNFLKTNLAHWNELAAINLKSDFYDLEGFKQGKLSLLPIEREELGIQSRFICSDVYDLPNVLDETFDIVFASYGVLCWLPDIKKWMGIVSEFLKPGGTFYIVDLHPFGNVFQNERDTSRLDVAYSYFHSPEPDRVAPMGSYADRDAEVKNPTYEWTHGMSDIVNAVIGAGMEIEFLHEFSSCCFQRFPFMKKSEDGLWHLEDGYIKIPLMFSLSAKAALTSKNLKRR